MPKRISKELARKLGEANMLYIDRKFAEAEVIFKEVIKADPRNADSYSGLGLMYEEVGDNEKALQYYRLAAAFKPSQFLWERIAELSQKQEMPTQAAYSLNRALKKNPHDIDMELERARLLSEGGNAPKAIAALQALHNKHPEDMRVVRAVAQLHYDLEAPDQAAAILRRALQLHPGDPELVNCLCEAYIAMGEWESIVQILGSEKSLFPDLSAKLAVALVHLGEAEEAARVSASVRATPVLDCGDLHDDIGTAHYAVGAYTAALEWLAPLKNLEAFNNPAFKLKMARCLRALGRPAEAIEYYKQVIETDSSAEVRVELADIYRATGQVLEALGVVDQPQAGPEREGPPLLHYEELPIVVEQDPRLVCAKAELLLQRSELAEFVATARPVLDVVCSFNFHKRRKNLNRVRAEEIRSTQGAPVPEDEQPLEQLTDFLFGRRSKTPKRVTSSPAEKATWTGEEVYDIIDAERLYNIALQSCRSLMVLGRHTEGAALANQCLHISAFPKHNSDLRSLIVGIAMSAQNWFLAYEPLREEIRAHPDDVALWRLFNLVAIKTGSFQRNSKFLARQSAKYPSSVPLGIAMGNTLYQHGSYTNALDEYLRILPSAPNESLLNLLIGLAYLHYALAKSTRQPNIAIVKAFAFLQHYARIRVDEEPSEVYYNIARAFHNLSLFNFAIPFYTRVLEAGATTRQKPDGANRDLSQEAAFNLSLIQRMGGDRRLARATLMEYIVV